MFEVVLADDHPVFLLGMNSYIENFPNFRVIKTASNGEEALNYILELKPEIAILDIDMPKKSGIEVAAELFKRKNETKIILLTFFLNQENYYKALKIGIHGLLMKENALNEINECLQKVSNNLSYISAHCHNHLENDKVSMDDYFLSNPDLSILSDTELTVLRKVSENKTNREIAEEIYKSEKTIKNHRYNICQKLNLKGSNGLLEFALKFKHLLN